MEVIKKKMNSLKEKLVQSEAAATEAENEYNEIMIKAEDKEAEEVSLSEKLAALEDELDEKESRLSELRARYEEALKLSDENVRAHVELKNRGHTDNTKSDRLTIELDELVSDNDRLEQEYQEAMITLEENENVQDEQEERLSALDSRVKELEVEAVQSGNLLRSMKINEGVASESFNKSESKYSEMTERVAQMEELACAKEEKAKELEDTVAESEDELALEIVRYNETKTGYDAVLAEVTEF